MTAPYAATVITGKDLNAVFADRSPLVLAALGAGCISASGILVKLADTGTATAAFYRCLVALPLLAPLALIEQRRLGRRPLAARGWACLSGLFLGVDLVLWNHAIAEVGAGIATVLGNLQVLFVTFAAWALWRERPGRRVLVALPVVMVGVVLVSGLAGGDAGGGHPLAGIVFGVATSAAYATFLLIFRRTSAGARHIAGPLTDATAGAAAGSLLLGLVFGGLQFDIRWSSLAWLLLLALTSQTMGWLLITSSLPRLPAAIAALTLLLQPAAALVLAAAILGERPSLIQVAGAAVVCCGVLAVARAAPAGNSGEPSPRAGIAGGSGGSSPRAGIAGGSGGSSPRAGSVPATAGSSPGSWPAARSRRPAPQPGPGKPAAGDQSSAG